MYKRNILLLIALFFTVFLQAQTGFIIEGKITDKDSNEPIMNALVVIKGENITATSSDEKGNFILQSTSTEMVNLWVTHLGYSGFEVAIKPGNFAIIKLEWMPVTTNDILVTTNPLGIVSQSEIIHDEVKSMGRQKNVADIFKDVSGFGVIKRGAYAMDPTFRAFKYEQLNIQCDGGSKVMNACPNRMDPITTHIISEEVEKVELIKGPFSMRFGPNFGGVINLVTQKRATPDNYGFHGSIKGGYEFNGDAKILGVALSQANNNYDVSLHGEMHDFGNYKDGEGTVVPSSFKSYDYSLKTGWNPNKNQRVQMVWRQSFGMDVLHGGLPMDTDHDNSSLLSVDYKRQNISPKLYSFSAKGFYSYVDHLMENSRRPNAKVVDAASAVFATTYGGKMELTFTPSEKSIIYAGLDMNNISRTGDRIRTIKRNPLNPEIIFEIPKIATDSIWQDGKIFNYGIFGEGKFILNPKATVSVGTRVDYVAAKIGAPAADFAQLYTDLEKTTEINISGSLTLDYNPNANMNIQLAAGRGVRSANMIERYINHFGVSSDPYEYVGNPNLKAEANHQLELSFKGKAGKIYYGASTYYSYITNYITAYIDTTIARKFTPWIEPKVAKRFQNADAATQMGFEAFVEMPIIKDLKLRVDASYIKATNLDLDEPMPLISPFSTLVSLTYTKAKYWVDLRTRLVAEQSEIATSFGEQVAPGFKTFDLRLGVKPLKGLSVGMAVINIFDAVYYEHLNFSYRNSNINNGRIFESGRNITAFVKYAF